jgi:DNA-binding PucR family transcriptional regulator
MSSQAVGTHARFLQAELQLGFTFTTIASQRYETGYEESAGKSLSNAERAYETVSRFLSDPKHSKRLTDAEVRDLTADLDRLRGELRKLEKFRHKAMTKETRHAGSNN